MSLESALKRKKKKRKSLLVSPSSPLKLGI